MDEECKEIMRLISKALCEKEVKYLSGLTALTGLLLLAFISEGRNKADFLSFASDAWDEMNSELR